MVWGHTFCETNDKEMERNELAYESDDSKDEETQMMEFGDESDDSGDVGDEEIERPVELGMEGGDEFDDSRDGEMERQVLEHLQPPKNVQKLDIICYGGKELPSWIGDPLCAPNIVRLRIVDCKRVIRLPPLGRLPLLKELTLCGLDGVTSVGDELCGYDDLKPFPSLDAIFVSDRQGRNVFPSLETLSISDMKGWEEWSFPRGLYVLRKLVLESCPKLTGKLPSDLPALKELKIRYCPQLTGKLPTLLPSIEKLQIWRCPQLTTTPLATRVASLSDLDLVECVIDEGSLQVHLRSLTRLRITRNSDLYDLNMLNSLACLSVLTIKGCSRLMSFGQVSLPSTLKILDLEECPVLKNLPPMHADCFLEILHIKRCESLECFPVAEEATSRESVCWRVKRLCIASCNKLSEDIMVHDIEHLRIENCTSLTCFPASGKKLSSSLKSLKIAYCKNLRTLTEGILMQDHDMPWSLEDMEISFCKSLVCFPTVGKLPTSLKRLIIEDCYELAVIPEALPRSSLEEIDIYGCLELEELPVSLVENNILSLKEVTLMGCESLRCLPYQINNLTGLVELSVIHCPAIRWSNIPQGGRIGLPLNLKKLSIGKTLLLEADMWKWGLDCLTSLQFLNINGYDMDDVISFPEFGNGKCFLLPTSITSLEIFHFKNLKFLSNGLQELSSLQHLSILCCPQLRSLPSLPSTFRALTISGSPNMTGRYKKDGGDYWPSVSHIPPVSIDGEDQ